jgi:formate dehydrogenase subunit delta
MPRVDKLVMMANQIARNLAAQGEAKSVTGTADHIARFWDPRMRAAIIAHAAKGGADLSPTARAAVLSLPAPTTPAA